MPQLPWIPVNANPSQRAQQIVNRGRPLTKSYPQSTFAVTAQNGAPLAPGESKWNRLVNGGLQTSGDPRATGAFYDVITPDGLQSLLTGGAPSTVAVGGDSYVSPNSQIPPIFWIAGIGILIALWLK